MEKLPNIKEMMKLKNIEMSKIPTRYIICGVKDEKIGFIDFLPVKSLEIAIRGFAVAVNDENKANMMKKYPEDFSLYKLCEIESIENNDEIKPCYSLIVKANELIKPE